jgi:hypothetical protein
MRGPLFLYLIIRRARCQPVLINSRDKIPNLSSDCLRGDWGQSPSRVVFVLMKGGRMSSSAVRVASLS